jgi:two-component system response regulator YesN
LHLENALFYHSRSGTLAQLAYGELIHSSPSRSGDDPAPEEEWLNRHQDLRWAFGTEDWNRLISEVEERRPGADRLLAFGEALCRDWKGSLFSQTEAEHLLEASHSCRNWPDWTVWLRRIADLAKRRMLDLALSKEVILCLIRAMIYMRLHAYDKMNQADVADHVNMSRSYFSQCFSRFAGQPFKDVLRMMRMERAKAYLLESNTPVYEIAMSVGFEDDKYFSKLFRDLFGKYPTEFRMDGKPF